MVLTRQTVKAVERPASFELEDVWKGGYLVHATDGAPDVVLVASGSELPVAREAAAQLAAKKVAARVVSMPSLERFLSQLETYRNGLLPQDGTPIVAVEAGLAESFRRVLGSRGLVYGIDHFGASAPGGVLGKEFGFTPEALAAKVLTHLEPRS
jgi:transketolase